jgi:hypothetical protein
MIDIYYIRCRYEMSEFVAWIPFAIVVVWLVLITLKPIAG